MESASGASLAKGVSSVSGLAVSNGIPKRLSSSRRYGEVEAKISLWLMADSRCKKCITLF